MAYGLAIEATVGYTDSEGADESLSITDYLLAITNKQYTKLKVNVGTSEEALELGEVSSLGYIVMLNRSTTVTIQVRWGSGQEKVVKIPQSGIAIFYFGSDVTAPYVLTDSSTAQLEYLLVSQ